MKFKLITAILCALTIIGSTEVKANDSESKIPTSGVTAVLEVDLNKICTKVQNKDINNVEAKEESTEDEQPEVEEQPEVIVDPYEWRGRIVDLINTTVGNIGYVWGNKPICGNEDAHLGLDCSGYVEYIFKGLNINYSGCLESTCTITESTDEIRYEELQIGDLGLLRPYGSYYLNDDGQTNYTGDFNGDGIIDDTAKLIANHVGIYIGKDENGNDLWAHCSGRAGTVVINNFSSFKYFCRVRMN